MTKTEQSSYIQSQIEALKDEQWKLDANAKAVTRAGLKERAEAIAKQAADTQLIIDAFQEQLKELY